MHTAELHTTEVCTGSCINMQTFKEVKSPYYEHGKILAFGQTFPKKFACGKKFAHGQRSKKPKIMTTTKDEDDADWVFLPDIMPDAQ